MAASSLGLDDEQQKEKRAKYVARKLTSKGGFAEGRAGFRHRTLPYLLGLESKGKVSLVVASILKLLPLFLGAMMPVVARKVYPQDAAAARVAAQGPEAVLKAVASMDFTDAALISTVVSIAVVNKLSERFFKRAKAHSNNPQARMCEAIESLPVDQLAGLNDSRHASNLLLKTCLAGIKHEICSLLLDDAGKVVTDVVYWEFSDNQGRRMHVRSRLVTDKPQRPSVDSFSLQAYYVARSGKVFAEHDFQHRDNPFPKDRASVADKNVKSTYKSVLFIPIITTEESVGHSGDVVDYDYCIGVICVASDRPFRFWRWGDHNRDEGTFGKVAYDHVRHYIQLIRRLAMHGAYRVEVNA